MFYRWFPRLSFLIIMGHPSTLGCIDLHGDTSVTLCDFTFLILWEWAMVLKGQIECEVIDQVGARMQSFAEWRGSVRPQSKPGWEQEATGWAGAELASILNLIQVPNARTDFY